MVSRSFRASCIIRVILLSATIFIFFFLFPRMPELCAILGILIVLETVTLIRFVDRTNKELARFFESVRYGDFSQTFRSKRLGGSFRPLLDAMADVNEAFRKTRAEKEEQTHYLETVVQHVGVGLLAFGPDGSVELMNNAAKRLLKVAGLKNLSFLETVSPYLAATLRNLKPPEKSLVKIELAEEPLQLVLHSTELRLRGRVVTLVSLQNIRSEIENTEIEAWQKLIRVLTHEIMNSITPIASLASTVQDLVRRLSRRRQSAEMSDIGQAAATIQKRSEGLLRFVDAYRNLAALPKANLQAVPVRDLFDRVGQLLKTDFKRHSVAFETSLDPENLEVMADPELVEQALLNLGLNAVHAVQGRKESKIRFAARLDSRGKVLIDVADNGPGISGETLEKVFIPFFSTKKGGSGIGLSLSRQIMRLHNGTLTVRSKPGEETVFTMRF